MTDAELVERIKKYWMTRGTPAGPGNWRAIERELHRRTRDDFQSIRNRNRRAASWERAA